MCVQSVIAAIHDKALRLSAPAVAQFGRGYVLNLVSNDARRINDGLTNGLNAVLGPVELLVVFALLAVALGPLPALAGSACLLAIIPMQAGAAGQGVCCVCMAGTALQYETVDATASGHYHVAKHVASCCTEI